MQPTLLAAAMVRDWSIQFFGGSDALDETA